MGLTPYKRATPLAGCDPPSRQPTFQGRCKEPYNEQALKGTGTTDLAPDVNPTREATGDRGAPRPTFPIAALSSQDPRAAPQAHWPPRSFSRPPSSTIGASLPCLRPQAPSHWFANPACLLSGFFQWPTRLHPLRLLGESNAS